VRYEAERYGRVRDVYIVKDHNTGQPRGLAFVEFTDPRDCEDAAHGMDGMEICEQRVGGEVGSGE